MEKTFNIKVISIDEKGITCHVIETNENRVFKEILFAEDAEVGDEFTVVQKSTGSGFIIEFIPKQEKISRILIEKVNHKEIEQDCYIPQIKINDKWHNVLEKGSYILKDSFDPVTLCKGCYGEGCQECKKRGFRKGESVDLKYIAQSFIDKEIKKIQDANNILNKYE